ncbi:MAG: polysaccharide biosynthesis C-terminal domain-containing protein [Acidobacteriota bacterium]|nr:polysaccharide biosynthesis C-terminal domain-containing protein [Acidobacteriota bacterium]
MTINILAPIMVGRLLGAEGVGEWTLLVAAGTLLHTALINWTHTSTVRFGTEEWTAGHSLNRTLGSRLPLLAMSIVVAGILLVAQPGLWLERWFSTSPSDRWLVALAAISVWFAAEAQAALQAAGRIIWQATMAPVVAIASMAALTGLFVSGQSSLTLTVVAFAAPPILGWGAVWTYNLARSQTRLQLLAIDDTWRHLRYAAPVLPAFALGYLSDWGDHLLLSRYSTVTEVGLFGIAYQGMVTTMSASGVLVTMLLPRLIAAEMARPGSMRTYVEEEVPTLYSLWMLGTIWVVAVLPLAVGSFAGPRFNESVGLLLVLLIVVPSSVAASLYTVLFSVQQRMGRVLVFLLVMAVINLGLSRQLIPVYGALGAAIGTVVSYLVYQACYIQDQHRILAVSPRRIWILWSAGLVVGVSQFAVGVDVAVRLAWAVAATAGLIAIIRLARCADAALLCRLLAAHPSLGQLAARVLAPGTAY